VMKQNVVCYEEDTPALAVYEFLCRVTIRGAVIVKQGRPTGIISRTSLLRFFMNQLAVNREGGDHHDLDAAEAAMSSFGAAQQPRDLIGQTVRVLAHEISDLNSRLDQETDDLIPCVVGGVSRVQELVNDLLAISRYANEHRNEPAEGDTGSLAALGGMPQDEAGLLAALNAAAGTSIAN
jgi:two-component system cell cycle response regulator